MEDITTILKLLFGQLGVVGTVCFIMSAYLAWLYDQERKDHKATRDAITKDVNERLQIHYKYLEMFEKLNAVLEVIKRRRG